MTPLLVNFKWHLMNERIYKEMEGGKIYKGFIKNERIYIFFGKGIKGLYASQLKAKDGYLWRVNFIKANLVNTFFPYVFT